MDPEQLFEGGLRAINGNCLYDAVYLFEKGKVLAPADVRFPYFLGIGWMKRQQYEQAKTEFAEAYVLDPDFIQNGIRNYRYPIVDSKIRKLLSEAININTADKT